MDDCLAEIMEALKLFADFAIAFFTAALALATFILAKDSRKASEKQIAAWEENTNKQIETWRKTSVERMGVQTWLAMEARFDSKEMRRARKKLALQLDPYNPSEHNEIREEVLELFESIGTIYNAGWIDKKLADESFSFHANHWWEAARPYIKTERRRKGDDDSIFGQFQQMCEKMGKHDPEIDPIKLKTFLAEERGLFVD